MFGLEVKREGKVEIQIKIKTEILFSKSSEHINEKGDRPYRGFDY